MSKKPTCAVLYRRVSSKRQSEEGESLADQETALRALCKSKGWKVIESLEDAVSGRSESLHKRNGLAEAIGLCCEHKAVMVVYDVTRLARSIIDGCKIIEKLRDCGAGLYILNTGLDTTTAMGKFVVHQLLAFGQLSSDLIGEYVKRANAETVKRKGYRTQGTQPYGWKLDDNNNRVPHPDEQNVLHTIRDLRKAGKTWDAIAAELNQMGAPARLSDKWTRGSVYRLAGNKLAPRHNSGGQTGASPSRAS